MTQSGSRIEAVVEFLADQQRKDLLRFITCGSVDDGKSTLIGRMLYESKLIFEDQLAQLEEDSRRSGTQGGDLDLALLVDGLSAEREQGITIDVAYRYFSTEKRKFIVADTPGHEQYTRHMVTGASTADLAVILVDARQGLMTQTRRHTYLVSLLGIRRVVLAVNKMDIVGFDQDVFERIAAEYRAFASRLGLDHITCIPVSALRGDNILSPSAHMDWFDGLPLLGHLEQVPVEDERQAGPLRLPIQWVNRPHQGFRGYSGMIVRGAVAVGDGVRVLPSGRQSRIKGILVGDRDASEAGAGESVTVTLDDELDISRGDVIAAASNPASVADQFEATVVWMSEEALLPGRSYLVKLGTTTVPATVAPLKHRIDVNSLERLPARELGLNEIGVVNLEFERPVVFDAYQECREMGGFILIDRITNETLGAGMLHFALRRSQNVHWHALDVDRAARASLKRQKPCVLWFTGLSGSGKSTVANLVEKRLHAMQRHTYVLDGDNVRHGLNKDLGFTDADRVENIRRVAEVAALMADAGLIVLVSFISPFRSERAMARGLVSEGEFFEIYMDTPLAVAEQRDPKGLYAKARRGELKNFTGIDSPYEPPEAPEFSIDTSEVDPGEAAEQIVRKLVERGFLQADH